MHGEGEKGREPIRRQLSNDSRLSAHSLPDIVREFEGAVADLFGILQMDGMKVKRGHLINALVCKYLALSHEQRISFASQGMQLLEERLGSPEPTPGGGRASSPVAARTVRPKRKGKNGNGGRQTSGAAGGKGED